MEFLQYVVCFHALYVYIHVVYAQMQTLHMPVCAVDWFLKEHYGKEPIKNHLFKWATDSEVVKSEGQG